MKTFTKESLELLRQRVDVVEVISSYISLTKVGSSYKALCPFHEEKTPSFIVQTKGSHFHCYGCGAHGDAIEFLMKHLGIGFIEAVENLADRFGIHLEFKTTDLDKQEINKSVLKDALEKANRMFHFFLLHTKEGSLALAYLYKRGIDLDFIKKFEIGYAPVSNLLQKTLYEQKIKKETLKEVGLVTFRAGRMVDFFVDRIMIPIRDKRGDVVAFSARKFKEDSGPKYINSPETILFKKSKMLFGLSYSRSQIAKEKRAIVVEGQFDTLRLIHSGFSIAVASQGTAFTDSHAKELIDLGVSRIYLALDSDNAGQEAAIKIGDLFQKEAIEVFVVELPGNIDPDLMIREKGPIAWKKAIEESIDYLTFLVKFMKKKYDVQSPSQKNELVQTIASRIRRWDHPLMVYESLKKLANIINVPPSMVGAGESLAPNVFVKKTSSISFSQVDPDRVLEIDLLRWLFLMGEEIPSLIEIARLNLKLEHFKVSICRRIYKTYIEKCTEGESIDLSSLIKNVDSVEEQLFLSQILHRKVNREKAKELFLETLQKILDRHWMERREEIKEEINSGKYSTEEVLDLAKRFDEVKRNKPQVVLPI